MMKPCIAIALSGGIDSLISAHLLKEKGYSVFGIHFITGFETSGDSNSLSSQGLVSNLKKQLNIPIHILDCRKAFKTHVVDYFTRTYMAGQTPNPCMICNPFIKFGVLLDAALELGATGLATGHYAKVLKDSLGIYRLYRGVDQKKEQSYFLALLNQKQLSHAHFPLANMTKLEVKSLATEKGLTSVSSKESQDICFVNDNSYSEFLMQYVDFSPTPGIIEDSKGNHLGQHQGLHKYTIGQRRGINCPGPAAYYVLKIDPSKNRLVIGFKDELSASHCQVKQINWIVPDISPGIRVHTRIRYRHVAALSTVWPADDQGATVRFDMPQNAITPGQGAVFYRKNEVLGGGWISS
jgi:tRNA-uridine 2-sulfurtransferase